MELWGQSNGGLSEESVVQRDIGKGVKRALEQRSEELRIRVRIGCPLTTWLFHIIAMN